MQTFRNLTVPARILVKKTIKMPAAVISDMLPKTAAAAESVLVLMYHRVNSYRRNELSVPADQFGKQIKWIYNQGFVNLRMADLESGNVPDTGTAARIIFTFDDGYEDNYHWAYPILRNYGYTGIFYLATDYVGSERMFAWDIRDGSRPGHNKLLNWDQVSEMLAAGMEIGSHTKTHVDLRNVSPATATPEIVESRQHLEEKLDTTITSFCYPFGNYNPAAVSLVRRGGYLSACTTDIGRWDGQDLMTIPRVPVLASDAFFVFKQKIRGRMDWFTFIQ